MLLRALSATAATVACLCAASTVEDAGATTQCDPGQVSCEAASFEGDESELLQTKARADLKQWSATQSNASKYTFRQEHARVFAALTKLTYCSASWGTAGSVEKTCGNKGFCQAAGVKVQAKSVRTISLNDGTSQNALVAYVAKLQSVAGAEHPLQPGCVIAVRGTWPGTNNNERSMQWTMVPVEYGTCTTCRVHEGYQTVWEKLMSPITNSLKSIKCQGDIPIYVTGHSFGGALATFGMYAMKTVGWNVQPSYVFHNPKVGDAEWVKSFNAIIAGSPDAAAVTRITHHADKVAQFPGMVQEDGSVYAYTYPEVHYYDKVASSEESDSHDHDTEAEYQVCWGEEGCGFLQYSELCSQSQCDDHVINPLAPDKNIAVFSDPTAVCTQGKGTVEAHGALPKAGQSTDNQMDWMSHEVHAEQPPCVNGWHVANDCVASFVYQGQRINGCTTVDMSDGTQWCSLDESYDERWNACHLCEGDEEPVASWDSLAPAGASGWNYKNIANWR